MRKLQLLYVLVLLSTVSLSQSAFPAIWPLDAPFVITGNYGELRPNHFHDGLDLSANGQMNLQVYAVEEGYVSRIKVSATGYGKSVYITHPNGRVTVYAHLNRFSLKIASEVLKEQRARKSFEVEIFPKPDALLVRRSEIIGLSGNTGGSTGPHLHFEIRDEQSETPLNPLLFLKIKDVVPPTLQKIAFYDVSDTCNSKLLRTFGLRNGRGHLLAEADTLVLAQSLLGFAFSGFDTYLVNGNHNNIFNATLYLDGQQIYSHTLNGIDFSDNRYVNHFSETRGKLKFQKCFLPTLYPPNMYGACVNKGRIILNDLRSHLLELNVKDESGNERKLKCYIKTTKLNTWQPPATDSAAFVTCSRNVRLHLQGLSLFFPAKTLFFSVPLNISNTLEINDKLLIVPAEINFHNAATLAFKAPEKFKSAANKLVLKSGSQSYAPLFRNDSLIYNIKNLGSFYLLKDTIGPTIRTQLAEHQLHRIAKPASLSFVVDDKGCGLKSYSLYINNNWVIGEYDAKYDLITYYFDEESPTGNLEFRLEAEDHVGNSSVFTCTLRR